MFGRFSDSHLHSRMALVSRIDDIVSAIRRHHGLELHSCQKQAGTAMTSRTIVEMATGEGKTAAALLPVVNAAANGQTVFVVTANDYLARRDAEFSEPVLRDFQCSVGCLQANSSPADRSRAYQSSVVYGTMKEFVFDFLRDSIASANFASSLRLQASADNAWVRQPAASTLVIDEADSILIDEAVTPCVVSAPGMACDQAVVQCLIWGAQLTGQLVAGEDYVELASDEIVTTVSGRTKISRWPFPSEISSLTLGEVFHWLELSIQAHRRFRRGVDYIVHNGRVLIIDESTGRVAEGRKWSHGVHQAIEARERLSVTAGNEPRALLTIQNYVGRFSRICGMTGTAREVKHEFRSVYGLKVESVPLHRPSLRRLLPTVACESQDEKLTRIVTQIREMQRQGRPILIGTRTVLSSQVISKMLDAEQISHVVLNALKPEAESPIIAEAGQPGRVTVATNMAGRGTDIRLHPQVAERGGLHVIGSELHSAARIDRQLLGRCGRQGDPGSFLQFVSLEDDNLAEAWGLDKAADLRRRSRSSEDIQRQARLAQLELEQEARRRRFQMCRQQQRRTELLEKLGLDPVLNPVVENL